MQMPRANAVDRLSCNYQVEGLGLKGNHIEIDLPQAVSFFYIHFIVLSSLTNLYHCFVARLVMHL